MGAHHQRLAHASPPVYEPAVMNPSITVGSGTGSDDPAITIDLNPMVPKTVSDALLEPTVIWVAVVVLFNSRFHEESNLNILDATQVFDSH